MRRITTAAIVTGLVVAGALTACSSGGSTADGKTDLSMSLWSPAEMAEQQLCVTGFEKKNANINVKIQQYGWGDYWSTLTTNMAAGNAPDVITMSSVYFPQYAKQGQLLDLTDLVKTSNINLDDYVSNLGHVWSDENGEGIYALPKDWSTQGIFYNKDLLSAAGVSDQQMQTMAWNPTDGGTYEKIIAHATVDMNGVRGDEAGFDKNNVDVYGLGLVGSGGALGQVEWSPYTLSDGWTYANKNPWGNKFNYADPKFKETISWWQSLITKGYMPPLKAALSAVSTQVPYASGKYAMVTEGSFNTGLYYVDNVPTGIAPTPIGPNGKRGTMLGANAYSVWAGTKHPLEAGKLEAYLASPECQDMIATDGTVYPTLKSSSELAIETQTAKGYDVKPFSSYLTDGSAVLGPITDHWSEVVGIMQPAMDAIMGFSAPVSSLDAANAKINALYK